MHRWTLGTLFALLALSLAACPASSTQKANDCDLDVEKLTGDWVSLKGGGTGQDVPDKYARLRFYEEDGKRKAIYTAGQLVPGKPMTNKYKYEFLEKDSLQAAVYVKNMFPDKSNQRIERLKKDNRSLGLKFEGRMYISIDKKRCALVLSDMYVTYVKGERTEDSNPAGTRTYLRANPKDPPLAFEHCTESGQLMAFATETVDWAKDQPLDPKGGIYKNEPVWFHWVNKVYEGYSEEDAKKALTKDGYYAEEGATYELEMWEKDHPWGGSHELVKKTIVPDEDGVLRWNWQGAFNSAPKDGIFGELYRYKTVGGKRTLIGASCNYFEPEPERTADEKKAEEEAAEDGK